VILNGGDAAIVLSMAGSLRRELGPGTEIRVLCHSVDAARRLYGGELDILPALEEAHRGGGRSRLGRKLLNETFALRARLGLFVGAERAVADSFGWADVIVSCGGGFMTDRYSPGKRLAALGVALASGRPLVFYAQSVGPFARESSRAKFRAVLARAAAITVRDERSLREVGAMGLSAELTADEALLFDEARPAAPPRPAPPPDLRAGLGPGRPLVAVSLRNWHFPDSPGERGRLNERYLGAVAETARRLVRERGARVLFVSTCQGVPEYGHDDSGVAARVAERLSPEVAREVVVDRARHHPAELRAILGGCDAAVATRMHAAILAMLAGTPALAVGYEAKSRELYARMNLAEWCLDISGPEVENLPERAGALLDRRAELRARLPEELAALAGEARANAGMVRRVLEDRKAFS
jgi:colanic acid/amylovoran biosynthesis protein